MNYKTRILLVTDIPTAHIDQHELVIPLGKFSSGITAFYKQVSRALGDFCLNRKLVLSERLLVIPISRYRVVAWSLNDEYLKQV